MRAEASTQRPHHRQVRSRRSRRSLGLLSIRERMTAIGGDLMIRYGAGDDRGVAATGVPSALSRTPA